MVMAVGDKWRFLRHKLSPAFTSGKIKLMYNTISNKENYLIKAIEIASSKGLVDIKDISKRFTIDVVSSCAFGMEANTLMFEHPEFVAIFNKIIGNEGTSIARFLFLATFPDFSKFFGLRLFGKNVETFFTNLVSGTINYRETNDVSRNDFLNMLIELKNKGSIDGEISTEKRKLSLEDCIAQAFVFYLGGVETSSTVMSFAIMELSCHPEVQEKVRDEVLTKLKSTNGEITYDVLQDMPYLAQVINETLRMYSPGFATFRKALHDYKIPDSKHVIKKGSQIMIPNIGFHYDERYWKDPKVFNPDRFTPEETAKRPHCTFMPFGEGSRNCIGLRFAQVTLKFALATMIRNFKVTLDTSKIKTPFTIDPKNPNLLPLGGFWVKFEKVE